MSGHSGWMGRHTGWMGGHLETEQVAVQANIAAEQTRYEAQRIQVGTVS